MAKIILNQLIEDIRETAEKTGAWTYSPEVEDNYIYERTSGSYSWGLHKELSGDPGASRAAIFMGLDFEYDDAHVPIAGTVRWVHFTSGTDPLALRATQMGFELKSLAPIVSGNLSRGEQIDLVFSLLLAGDSKIFASKSDDTIYGDASQTASGSDRIYGGDGRDRLFGNGGSDKLYGEAGNDMLWGGRGFDKFVFNVAPGAGDADRIMDFLRGSDEIQLKGSLFGNRAAGALGDVRFKTVYGGDPSKDLDATDRIVYDKMHGDLYFDVDGSGSSQGKLFAHMENHAALSASDFLVV